MGDGAKALVYKTNLISTIVDIIEMCFAFVSL